MSASSPDTGSPESEMYMENEGTKIRVSGLSDESVITRERLYETITNANKKMRRITAISELTINVNKYHEHGKRKKYSVKISALTETGLVHSEDFEWDVFLALKKTLGKLETVLVKKEDKSKVHARAP